MRWMRVVVLVSIHPRTARPCPVPPAAALPHPLLPRHLRLLCRAQDRRSWLGVVAAQALRPVELVPARLLRTVARRRVGAAATATLVDRMMSVAEVRECATWAP